MHGLRDLGYVEGQNLILERRSAEGDTSGSATSWPSWVRVKADVIVTTNLKTARALRITIPDSVRIRTDELID